MKCDICGAPSPKIAAIPKGWIRVSGSDYLSGCWYAIEFNMCPSCWLSNPGVACCRDDCRECVEKIAPGAQESK